MKQRSIIGMILLTFITFGLYLIYWTISFQSELKEKTGEGFDGLGHFLMIIFTFGIYYIYWQYAAGKRLAKQGASDNSVIYIVLTLLSLGWLNPYLMQSQANTL